MPEAASRTHLRRWLWAPALALAVLAVVGVIDAASKAGTAPALKSRNVPRSFFGAVTLPEPTPGREAKLMARGGITSLRFPFAWTTAQSLPGAFRWATLDAEMASLARHHIRALPIVQGMPSWLDSNPYAFPRTGKQRRAWRAFVKAAVKRYGKKGHFWAQRPNLPYDPIRTWQVWNEPDHYFGGHGKKGRARAYARLLRLTAKTIRGVNPSATIVLAGLGPGLALKSQVPYYRFLDQLYRLHAERWFDVVADHPYAASFKAAMTQVRKTAAVMRRHHDRRRPLWVTELGWGSNRPKGSRDASLGKGSKGQARILRRSFKYLIGHRRKFHLGRVYWFDWIDTKPLPLGVAFGLRRADLTGKPSWRAFERFARP